MSNTSIPVIKFLFREDLKVLGDALNIGPGFEVQDIANSNDLSTYLSTVPAGLVVTSLYDRNDLIQIATFMKLGKKIAKDCAIKIVVFNFSKDRNFEKAIAKLGILDLVETNVNTKALKFKIDFWMKSLSAQVKNSAAANAQKIKTLDANKNVEKKNEAVVAASGINWLDPLEVEDDIWILKQDSDCKKVLSKWLVRLLGPSPYVGQWTELKSGLWRFDLKETERNLYLSNEGEWYFTGDQKPDFVWKENVWLISGDNFDLYFKDSSGRHSRLNCHSKVISVCKNSMFAKTKESIIIESLDKELVFKREAEKLEDLEGKNKTDQLDHGNLEGKNKTEEIDGGPLSGKTKTAADKSGNLSGKTKGEEAINHENLEQKSSTGKEKSHWNNKNSYEEEPAKDPLGVKAEKHRDGENLERENKDQEHRKHYKNHNDAEKYEAGEIGNNLSGKSSTDELPSHYGQKEKSKGLKEKEANDLDGKSSTDKIPSHYGRSSGDPAKTPEEKSRAEKENSKGFKEREANDLDGKSSTDKIASHYGRSSGESAKTPEAKARSEKEENEREIKESEKTPASAKTPEAKARSEKEENEREIKESEKSSASAKTPEAKARSEKEEKERELKENEKTSASPKTPEAKARSEKEEKEREIKDRDKTSAKTTEEKKQREKAQSEANGKDLAGKSHTDKLSSHYGNGNKEAQEKPEKKRREVEAFDEEWNPAAKARDGHIGTNKQNQYEDEESFSKSKPDKGWMDEKADKNSNDKSSHKSRTEHEDAKVVPLDRAREEKNKQLSEEEKALDKLTEDAQVISFITHKGERVKCGLDDFFDGTIIFHTEQQNLVLSAPVDLDMKFKFLNKETQLKINGSILTIDGDGEGKSFVTIKLNEENASSFNKFMKLYEIRQENVTEFFKKVKGI